MANDRDVDDPERAPVRVWIACDDALAATGIVERLRDAWGLALATSGDAADVVLWDPGAGAPPEDAPPIAEADHGVWVAFASSDERAARYLGLGAAGVLGRGASPAVLGAVLRAAGAGALAIDPVFRLFAAPTTASPDAPNLTPREMEVLELIAAGLSNRRIARRLGISEHTAKFHVNAILSKLDADTRTEAVVTAARLGVLLL